MTSKELKSLRKGRSTVKSNMSFTSTAKTPTQSIASGSVYTPRPGQRSSSPQTTEQLIAEANEFIEKINMKINPLVVAMDRSFSDEPYLRRLRQTSRATRPRRPTTPSSRTSTPTHLTESDYSSNESKCDNNRSACCKHGGRCEIAMTPFKFNNSTVSNHPSRSRCSSSGRSVGTPRRYEFTHSFSVGEGGEVNTAPRPRAVSTKIFELNGSSLRSVRRSRRSSSSVFLCDGCRKIMRSISRSSRLNVRGGVRSSTCRSSSCRSSRRSTAGLSPAVTNQKTMENDTYTDEMLMSFGSPRSIESPTRSVHCLSTPKAKDFIVRRSESTYVKPPASNTSPYHSPIGSRELTQDKQRSIMVSYGSSSSSSESTSPDDDDENVRAAQRMSSVEMERKVEEMFSNLGKFLSNPKPPKYYKGDTRLPNHPDEDVQNGRYGKQK